MDERTKFIAKLLEGETMTQAYSEFAIIHLEQANRIRSSIVYSHLSV